MKGLILKLILIGLATSTTFAVDPGLDLGLTKGFTAFPIADGKVEGRPTAASPEKFTAAGATFTATGWRHSGPGMLKADYQFQGNLNSSLSGAPPLANLGAGNMFAVDTVDGTARQTVRFPFNNGLAVNTAGLIPNDTYTIVVLFKFDDVSGFRRLIDFSDRQSDTGAYVEDGRLKHESPANPPFQPNTYVQVAFVRETSGILRGYLNGVLRFSFADGGTFQISPANSLRFFQDDLEFPDEASAGNVARIRLYDGPLTTAQVGALDRLPPAPTPTPTPSACQLSITPSSQTFAPAGGNRTVTVTTNNQNCGWSAQAEPSDPPFISVPSTSGAGIGNGTFTFSVPPNGTGFGREGTISIVKLGDSQVVYQMFVVTQPLAGCAYGVQPNGFLFAETGGSGMVSVETSPGCPWAAVSNDSFFISVGGGSGIGPGTFTFEVFSNGSSTFRTGSISVAGQNVNVSQRGDGCFSRAVLGDEVGSSDDCSAALARSSKPSCSLGRLYNLRDKVLANNERGKRYISDYYLYTGEITRLMIFNPNLLFRSKDVLERYQSVVESVLNRTRAKRDQTEINPTVITEDELDDVDELLHSFSKLASTSLQQSIEGLRRDIREPSVQAEFGVRVLPGKKRPLPIEGALGTSGIIGKLLFFNFRTGLHFLNPFSGQSR